MDIINTDGVFDTQDLDNIIINQQIMDLISMLYSIHDVYYVITLTNIIIEEIKQSIIIEEINQSIIIEIVTNLSND